MAKEYLSAIDFPKEKIEAVCHSIRFHSNKSYGKQQTIKAKLLYDADKLDAVGVMGIARTLIGIGDYNNPMYEIIDNKINMDENADNDTFIRYYLSRVAKNYDRFFTEKAKTLANQMKEIDTRYIQEFISTVNDNYNYSELLNQKLK